MVGALLGHPVRIVMPDNTTVERTQLLRLYRAEIIFSPGAEGSNGAIRMAQALAAADPELFMPFQYGNPANPLAHEEGTGPEILAAVPEVDVFVAGLGTGGTLTGVGRFLKRERPGVRIIAAEPLPGEQVQGSGHWRRGSCRRCSTHRSWTIATWSATARPCSACDA